MGTLCTYPIGPIQTPRYFSACHRWRFGDFDLADLLVARIRKLIDKAVAPVLPLSRLGLDSGPPPAMWARNFKMRKHLLPVYADFLYRLQHNALYLGYRLQHLPGDAILCHHGCGVLETAPHLFWYCPFATQVWAPWLNRFRPLFGSLLDWRSVLLFHVEPTPGAQLRYGYSLFEIFHIVRAVIVRWLWIHRNDIRFYNAASYLLGILARIHAVVNIHTDWFS